MVRFNLFYIIKLNNTEKEKIYVKSVLAQKSESQIIEIKSVHGGCPKRLYDTLSSFSNQDGGGTIIFGIDKTKKFSCTGIYDLHDLQKKVTEQCNQMIPPVRAIFTNCEYNGVTICSAEIPSIDLDNRPCYYAGAGKIKGSYICVGDDDLPMTDYEIYSYEAFNKHLHDDERPIDRATLNLLNTNEVESYVLKMKTNKPRFSTLNNDQIYELLSITRNHIPTLASLLNFGIYPQGLLPQLSIVAVVVPGNELGDLSIDGARFIDNKRIDGTLNEMLDSAISFCLRNMKTQTIINKENGKREDITEYPINAIREIILNALIHRDYSPYTEGTPIQIYFYSDRLEIHSPGGLYGRMTVEDLGKARPDLRNPLLATMSEFLLHTENRYSGIPTIYKEMKKHGLPKPLFENKRNEFIVTLFNSNHIEEVEEEDLISFCKTPRTRQEIKEHLKLTTTAYITTRYLNPLIEQGLLKLTIPDKPRSTNQKYYS